MLPRPRRARCLAGAMIAVALVACAWHLEANRPPAAAGNARVARSEAAAAEPAARVVGQIGGDVMDAALSGSGVVLAVGPRVETWDLAAPEQPVLRWRSRALDYALGLVAVGDDRTFALEARAGEADEPTACRAIRVFDSSDDHPPRPSGSVPCPAQVDDLDAAGHHLVLATVDGALVVDGSDAAAPELVGRLPGVRSARGVRLDRGLAFVAGEPDDAPGGAALMIFDASELPAARLVGRVDLPARSAAIDVSGRLAVVVSRACGVQAGMSVIDVSDPAEPRQTAFEPLSCGSLDVAAGDGAAHVLGFDYETMVESVFSFDLSDPSSPVGVAVTATPNGRRIAYGDGRVTIASGAVGAVVVDVGEPSAPKIVGHVPALGAAAAIGLSGANAYVTDSTGELWSLDVAHPERPRALGVAPTGADASALALYAGHAYVAQPDNTWSGRSGLHVVELRRYGSVQPRGFVELAARSETGDLIASPAPEQMAVSGQRLYVPSGRYGAGPVPGFWVLDLSAPADPAVVSFQPHVGDVLAIAADGETLYVAGGDSGVDVINMASGEAEIIGRAATAGPAADLSIGDSLLSVTLDGEGVRLFDVRDPLEPLGVGGISGVTATMTARLGDGLYVPGLWSDTGAADVRQFRVAEPSNPELVASAGLPETGRIAVGERLVAVAAGGLGVLLVTDLPTGEWLYLPSAHR